MKRKILAMSLIMVLMFSIPTYAATLADFQAQLPAECTAFDMDGNCFINHQTELNDGAIRRMPQWMILDGIDVYYSLAVAYKKIAEKIGYNVGVLHLSPITSEGLVFFTVNTNGTVYTAQGEVVDYTPTLK